MKTPSQTKIEEDLRFQIERVLWLRFEMGELKNVKSFTVQLEKGAVKSVKCKFDEPKPIIQ